MTIGLAKEVAGEGIRVNGIRPGIIHTDIHAKGGEPDWGMYQVIDLTGEGIFENGFRSVVDDFAHINNWEKYRKNMLSSTLAQADMHHAVLYIE